MVISLIFWGTSIPFHCGCTFTSQHFNVLPPTVALLWATERRGLWAAITCQTMLPPRFREPWDCEMSPPNCIHRTTDNLCGVRSFSKAFLYVLKAVSYKDLRFLMGFPDVISGEEPACQCRKCKRRGFDPWIRKIPWRTAWQHTPVFLPGESHEQRSLVGYSP